MLAAMYGRISCVKKLAEVGANVRLLFCFALESILDLVIENLLESADFDV